MVGLACGTLIIHLDQGCFVCVSVCVCGWGGGGGGQLLPNAVLTMTATNSDSDSDILAEFLRRPRVLSAPLPTLDPDPFGVIAFVQGGAFADAFGGAHVPVAMQ